jgi:Spy/CpxP family protein refolding chaperone
VTDVPSTPTPPPAGSPAPAAAPPQAGRTRLLGAALLVAAFSTGALVGAAGDRLLARDDGRDRRGPRFAFGSAHRPGGHVVEKRVLLFEPLDLSEEQRERIEDVLERGRGQLEESWRRIRPELGALVDSTHDEIRALLTPEQQRLFDRFREDRLRFRRRWGGGEDDVLLPGPGLRGLLPGRPPFDERRRDGRPRLPDDRADSPRADGGSEPARPDSAP